MDPMETAEFICSTGIRTRNLFWGYISRTMDTGADGKIMQPLSPARYQLLAVVDAHGPISITQLAQRMAVSLSSVSIMVDRMVQDGWLLRKHSLQDRRKVLVSLSAAAGQHIDRHRARVSSGIVDLIKSVGPETAKKWCEVLKAIDTALSREG